MIGVEIIEEAVEAAKENAKEAKKIKPDAYIALDIGPIGKLMEPMGTLTFDEVYQSVKQMSIPAAHSASAPGPLWMNTRSKRSLSIRTSRSLGPKG